MPVFQCRFQHPDSRLCSEACYEPEDAGDIGGIEAFVPVKHPPYVPLYEVPKASYLDDVGIESDVTMRVIGGVRSSDPERWIENMEELTKKRSDKMVIKQPIVILFSYDQKDYRVVVAPADNSRNQPIVNVELGFRDALGVESWQPTHLGDRLETKRIIARALLEVLGSPPTMIASGPTHAIIRLGSLY